MTSSLSLTVKAMPEVSIKVFCVFGDHSLSMGLFGCFSSYKNVLLIKRNSLPLELAAVVCGMFMKNFQFIWFIE